MGYPSDENGEIYVDDILDCGYESEAMIIEPGTYIRFPLPKGMYDLVSERNTIQSDESESDGVRSWMVRKIWSYQNRAISLLITFREPSQ